MGTSFDEIRKRIYTEPRKWKLPGGRRITVVPDASEVPPMRARQVKETGHFVLAFQMEDTEMRILHVDDLVEVYCGKHTGKLIMVVIKKPLKGDRVAEVMDCLNDVWKKFFHSGKTVSRANKPRDRLILADLAERQIEEIAEYLLEMAGA